MFSACAWRGCVDRFPESLSQGKAMTPCGVCKVSERGVTRGGWDKLSHPTVCHAAMYWRNRLFPEQKSYPKAKGVHRTFP